MVDTSRKPPRLERVLLVDDDPDIRRFIESIFRANGFEDIASADDGEEGLQLASDLLPDLIATNVMMPKLHGFEMVRLIREDVGLTEPCIIFVTAKALPSDRALGLEVGADEYIVKPFTPADLSRKVDAALARTAARREGLAARRREAGR